MIYYLLSVLMLTGIREICITSQDQEPFRRTLDDRWQWGLALSYAAQPSPDGLAQAYLLAKDFLKGAPFAMVSGDNVFFGHGLPGHLRAADEDRTGGTAFGDRVSRRAAPTCVCAGQGAGRRHVDRRSAIPITRSRCAN